MTAAYRTIQNLVYTIYTLSKYGNQQYSLHSLKTTLCTYICTNIQFQSISLQNILNYSTSTNVRRILICSSVRSACTWKIVFKTQNIVLNELSECMLYKIFFFSGKHLKTVKLSFTIIFQKPCLLTLKFLKLYVLACFCTCLLLKVYKTFNTCLLALTCLL